MIVHRVVRLRFVNVLMLGCLTCAGCGNGFNVSSAPLFVAQLSIEGTPIGDAIIDTGGGYELMLRDPYGLEIVNEVEILAFTGRQRVGVTEGFTFVAGGVEASANAAIVGPTICACNGLGYLFFRRSRVILGLDFARGLARFENYAPAGGIQIPFATPPASIAHFDSAFIEVDINSGGETQSVLALLDTGTNSTVLRRGVIGQPSLIFPDRLQVTLSREELGGVALRATLFDTPGLPDLIIGTDVMRAWADEWYFRFDTEGGAVTVFPSGISAGTNGNLLTARVFEPAANSARVGALRIEP